MRPAPAGCPTPPSGSRTTTAAGASTSSGSTGARRDGGASRRTSRGWGPAVRGEPLNMNHVAVLGPGRIGRQIALAFALGGGHVSLGGLKDRAAAEGAPGFAAAPPEGPRGLRVVAQEGGASVGGV